MAVCPLIRRPGPPRLVEALARAAGLDHPVCYCDVCDEDTTAQIPAGQALITAEDRVSAAIAANSTLYEAQQERTVPWPYEDTGRMLASARPATTLLALTATAGAALTGRPRATVVAAAAGLTAAAVGGIAQRALTRQAGLARTVMAAALLDAAGVDGRAAMREWLLGNGYPLRIRLAGAPGLRAHLAALS